jgi:hypothetical protein
VTELQIILLQDKFMLWRKASREGPTELRDYNRRCADALQALLSEWQGIGGSPKEHTE